MSWVLVFAMAGFTGASDIQIHRDMSEAQCLGVLAALSTAGNVGAVCVSPNGDVVTHD